MRRVRFFVACALTLLAPCLVLGQSELRFCLTSQPKTLNPLAVDDDASETIRYITGGVLIRLDRSTQQPVGELATGWRINKAGNAISFTLRPNLRFSDGTPFTASDVAFTVERLMDPELHSPTGDSFRSNSSKVETRITDSLHVTVTFPAPVIGLERLFDQVAIISAQSPQKIMAVLGPYYVAENKAGSYLLLKRNPNYWKRDQTGRQLPYIDSIRLDIQQNRDRELLRFTRGEIYLINSLNAESFDLLKSQAPGMAYDAGVALDSEQIWFNQVPSSPLPDYKKAWFNTVHFRRAVSSAIHREDISRVVFHGYAQPAVSLISPANKIWFNQKLKPHPYDVKLALRELELDGFRLQGDTLRIEVDILSNSQ